MIRVSQLKCIPERVTMPDGSMDRGLLIQKAAACMGIAQAQIKQLFIRRRSIDARKKPEIFYIFSVDVVLSGMTDEQFLLKNKAKDCQKSPWKEYSFPEEGEKRLSGRPLVVGMGPAGLFCAYTLAMHGYRPLLVERGRDVDARTKDVARFWREGLLQPNSNVQFGEGGAGAFSDGKLNTLIKDKDGRSAEVLRILCEHGAGEEICYDQKPHLGTDVLCGIVRRMREKIAALGGEIRFETQMTGFSLENGRITEVKAVGTGAKKEEQSVISCGAVVLAIGHSARDTVETLYKLGVPMEAKPFAVGLRVEHPQRFINESQYGTADAGVLGAAAYKLTAQAKSGRGVYTFCMCPGGYVVNASSEPGMLAVNGMSYSGRDTKNANSAVIVTVSPADYGDETPLSGIAFQRALERRAYEAGGGKVPVERYGDYKAKVLAERYGDDKAEVPAERYGDAKAEAPAERYGDDKEKVAAERCGEDKAKVAAERYGGHKAKVPAADGGAPGRSGTFDGSLTPCIKGQYEYAKVSGILPQALAVDFVEGMEAFDRKIPGFADDETLVAGVESRTSSPVRILRNEHLVSERFDNLYPCGEGAGYAGGIMSAAMDGLRVAEAIAAAYRRPE